MPEQSLYLSQQDIQERLLPLIKKIGKTYKKKKNILARPAIKGEIIETITSDGKETQNQVKDDSSFVIKNQTVAGESYILDKNSFLERYEWLRPAQYAYAEYQSKGTIIAIKLSAALWKELDFPDGSAYFEAPWGEKMVLKKFDYMASPPTLSEVYRIARKEFWETYQLLT